MAVFKCKMCGGALEVNNETVATCSYCGTQQTLPRLDDEKRAQLYDRANYFRRENEFDKAMGIYEMILSDEKTDSEAYWGIVLCRYGIEYVEDPRSHKRIPTVNRAQFTSIFDDEDYKKAVTYADSMQKGIYEAEATVIDKIQKGILALSSKEEPFDIFICYKETDNQGNRTQDSVYAQDIYNALVKEGYKVFFSRITLEDKLGSAYEPYIFAALNSAKVMLVVGTSKGNFNAVWVKNEWSRFISLIKAGKEKTLIPLYKDISPYEMPEEFQYLQSQDMGKIGYIQDVVHGVKKLVEGAKVTVKETVVVNSGNAQIEPLLKRAFIFLEDGDWNSANEYCEKVLDINPECAGAYLGKLLAELHVKKKEALKDCEIPFNNKNNYQKIIRYDIDLKAELSGYIEHIETRNESARLEGIYNQAKNLMDDGTADSLKNAVKLFESIEEYKDSSSLVKECTEKSEEARLFDIYTRAKDAMSSNSYQRAINFFESIGDYKDSSSLLNECVDLANKEKIERERIAEEKRIQKEQKAKRDRTYIITVSVVTVIVVVFAIVLNTVIMPNGKYNDAIALMEQGNYEKACSIFDELGDYKDSPAKAEESRWLKKIEQIKKAEVGDYITFGVYEQDNNTSNGVEEIEWLVLDIQDGKALVISRYALDCKRYNTEYEDVTWETCTLRRWLNNDFINTAFSTDEKAMIPTVTVTADENPEYDTDPGNDTQDKIFLLSIEEVNEYFDSDSARKCKGTYFAFANGALGGGSCWWWLRSPGYSQDIAASVINDGVVYVSGDCVDIGNIAVRPVMWITIE